MRKTQFGTPVTITSGGITDMSKLILKSSRPIKPKAQITAITTTAMHTHTTCHERKKANSSTADTSKARPRKSGISPRTKEVTSMRM